MDRISNDVEKSVPQIVKVEADSSSEEISTHSQRAPSVGFLEKWRCYEEALDRKLGVEAQSIERKLPENRNPFYARWSNQLVSLTREATCRMCMTEQKQQN